MREALARAQAGMSASGPTTVEAKAAFAYSAWSPSRPKDTR